MRKAGIEVRRYIFIFLGCLFYALGFSLFLEPAELAAGGLSGVVILIRHFFPFLDSGILLLALNAPLLIISGAVLGKRFVIDTLFATVLSGSLITLFGQIVSLSSFHIITSGLVGGVVCGIGLGIVFRQQATTGGTDIAVRLIRRKVTWLSSGMIFLLIDCTIVLLSGILFEDLSYIFYNALSLFACTVAFQLVYREKDAAAEKKNKGR